MERDPLTDTATVPPGDGTAEEPTDGLTDGQVEAAVTGEAQPVATGEAQPVATGEAPPAAEPAAVETLPTADPEAATSPAEPPMVAEPTPTTTTSPDVGTPDDDGASPAETRAETEGEAEAETAGVDAETAEPEDHADEPPPPPAVGPRSVGRLIADALRAAGVRYAFTVPGESFLGLLEGLSGAGIRVVTTRHEGAAAFMAEAYGSLTGRPAACVGTRAVGAANLAIGIHTARQNSTPMFALVGQVARDRRGREAFQEAELTEAFGRLALWSAEPRTAEEAATAVGEAIRQALGGRPGPVLLSLPEDLLDETAAESLTVDAHRPALPRADVSDVRAVLQLLATADRPVILAGGGVLRARTSSDLTKLAETLHVPVISAWRRGDVISNDHPLYLGMAGFGAPAVVRERLDSADAILVLGCRLNEVTSYDYAVPRAGVRWAHVDVEPRAGVPGLRDPDIAVRSDARAFVRAAVQRLRGAVLHAGHVEARDASNASDRSAWEAATAVDGGDWSGPGVHPGRIVATLRRLLPDEAILTTDAGNFGGWAARGFRFRRPGTFLGPTSGAMGYGLPAAIAAALVHRDRPVVALLGDGGLAMTVAELETAARERARVIAIVFDNERYGTIRMYQERRGADTTATDLGPIDFAAVARACGVRGVRVESDDAFEPALRQALAGDRATVIQLTLDRRWVSVDQPATGSA